MKLTKSKLQQIIKEELENIINQSPQLDDDPVKAYVAFLAASEYGGPMQSVGETLPRWLRTAQPLNSIKKKFPDLPWDKPVELKNRLGIDTLGPNGEKI
jgi:hypothetical protein